VSLHAEILRERHSKGRIADAAPIDQVIAGDFFLFLRSHFSPVNKDAWCRWVPHSAIILKEMPRFVLQSIGSKYATRLLPTLGIDSIATFRTKLGEALTKLSQIAPSTSSSEMRRRRRSRRNRSGVSNFSLMTSARPVLAVNPYEQFAPWKPSNGWAHARRDRFWNPGLAAWRKRA
jgi:hypothetical protein